jgi:glutathione peroxidase
MKFIYKLFLPLLVLITLFYLLKPEEMTVRQYLLKALYPVIMLLGKISPAKNAVQVNKDNKEPIVSFYSLQSTAINGDTIQFSQFKGMKVLIVNTASDCGYTGQYAELEKLYEQEKDKLVIIGFPANDFKEQEKRNNDEIASFCKKNYGVSFLLMQKSVVLKKENQNSVFQWLTDAAKNGWCNQQPVWNFSKYIVDETGKLQYFYANTVSPADPHFMKSIQ